MKKLIQLSATAWVLCLSLSSCFTSRQHASAPHRYNSTDDGLFSRRKNDDVDEGYVAENKNVYVSFKTTPYTSGPEVESAPVASKEEKRALPKSLRKKYAAILGVSYKEIDNQTLYKFIDKWWGTSYRLGGNDKSGIDCSAFAKRLFSDVYGVDLKRTAMDQFTSCKRIKNRKYAHEGDLVFFRAHGKRITHVGVYLTNDFFVHASTSQGVTISSLNEDYWHKYYVGMGRIPQ